MKGIVCSAYEAKGLLDGRISLLVRPAMRDLNEPSGYSAGEIRYVREPFLPRYFDGGRPAYKADWTADASDVCSEPAWRSATQMAAKESRMRVRICEDVRWVKFPFRHGSDVTLTKEDAIAAGAFFTDYGQSDGCMLSADGGKTWGRWRGKNNGWSMVHTTSHEHCLGSAEMALANWWIGGRYGRRRPYESDSWLWLIRVASLRWPNDSRKTSDRNGSVAAAQVGVSVPEIR